MTRNEQFHDALKTGWTPEQVEENLRRFARIEYDAWQTYARTPRTMSDYSAYLQGIVTALDPAQ